MSQKTFLCTECRFYGTDDNFSRHVLSPEYNYGHGNAAPEEVELQCPECGTWEQDGIVEATQCDYCEKYFNKDDITHLADADTNICVGCRVARNIIKGDTITTEIKGTFFLGGKHE